MLRPTVRVTVTQRYHAGASADHAQAVGRRRLRSATRVISRSAPGALETTPNIPRIAIRPDRRKSSAADLLSVTKELRAGDEVTPIASLRA